MCCNKAHHLLSSDTSEKLGIVKLMIGRIISDLAAGEFANLFKGLGKLKGEYHINLDTTVKPYGESTPRRVPIALLPKMKEELERLKELDAKLRKSRIIQNGVHPW